MRSLIIAEAGVNHNGCVDRAFELVDAAHSAGADVVKFQTFTASKIVTAKALKAEYQSASTGNDESQLEMLSRLELGPDTFAMLFEYCRKLGIEFLSTAFDSDSLNFLVNDLGLERLKIPSGDITNAPFLLEHARTGRDLILSTGMATLSEIEAALGVLAFGFSAPLDAKPSTEAFQSAYFSDHGKEKLAQKVTLLHCTSEYPAPLDDVNLSAMDTLKSSFKLAVGYSDHTEGVIVPVAAAARGAAVIEKHFTLDKSLEGPDHKASLDPIELEDMVASVRAIERTIGDGIKGPSSSELKNKFAIRKSLVAAQDITKGEVISRDHVLIKRPGGGQSPFDYWTIQEKRSSRSYKEGDLIFE